MHNPSLKILLLTYLLTALNAPLPTRDIWLSAKYNRLMNLIPRNELASNDVILFEFKFKTLRTETRAKTLADIFGTSLCEIFSQSNLK